MKATTPLENSKHSPRHMRIFLASPGDVPKEREAALDVLEKLNDDPFIRCCIHRMAW